MSKIEKPSLLSYERSLHPTDAAMRSSTGGGDRVPVRVLPKSVLGTASHYDKDPGERPEKFLGGNPQRIQSASLPVHHDVLHVDWNMAVTGSSLSASSCDQPPFRARLDAFVAAYAKVDGFRTISGRVAQNVANARWTWRNRVFASQVSVTVTVDGTTTHDFDALRIPLHDFSAVDARDGVPDGLVALADAVAQGLRGERVVRLGVTSALRMMRGATVYPSQEFVDKPSDKHEVGKFLFQLAVDDVSDCAAMHEQKIGNALRTYDTWYLGHERAPPIPVNPYGQDRATHSLARSGRRNGEGADGFYKLLDSGLDRMMAELEAGRVPYDSHFVVGVLLRGGVFGFGKKKTATAGAPDADASLEDAA